MYVCMYVCKYVCMYVSMYVCMDVCTYVCMYVCINACMYVCMLRNHTKTMVCRATKLHMPTEHLPGKVLKLYLIARLIGSNGFRNPILRDHVAMATNWKMAS